MKFDSFGCGEKHWERNGLVQTNAEEEKGSCWSEIGVTDDGTYVMATIAVVNTMVVISMFIVTVVTTDTSTSEQLHHKQRHIREKHRRCSIIQKVPTVATASIPKISSHAKGAAPPITVVPRYSNLIHTKTCEGGMAFLS